jgi:cold shock CspA family protein
VSRLFPEQGYGFLATPDGAEVYFQPNSLIRGAFDELAIGTEMIFVAEEGDNRLQANTARVVG